VLAEQAVLPGGSAVAPALNSYSTEDGFAIIYHGWDTEYHVVTENLVVRPLYTTYQIELNGSAPSGIYVLADQDYPISLEGLTYTMTICKNGETPTVSEKPLNTLIGLDVLWMSAETISEAYDGSNLKTIELAWRINDTITVPFGSFDIRIACLGDLDGNMTADANDAVQILQAYAASILGGASDLTTPEQIISADVTCDDTINSDDACMILARYAAEMVGQEYNWNVDSYMTEQ